MKQIISACIFFTLQLATFSSNAQHKISGKIIDALSKAPIEFAIVHIANSTETNTITDKFGEFVIIATTKNSIIQVSFIGYATTSVVADKPDLKISLQPATVNINEIIIVNNGGIRNKFNTVANIDLNLKPVNNSQEILRIVPGLFVAQHAGGGKAEQIFLRGFDIDHGTDIQISVDGMPVNMVSHAHGQGYADAHFIIPETINKIDYGTGPYYAQQGNLNTAGYVNFGTYNNIAQSKVLVEAGRFNTYRALAIIDLIKLNKEKQSAYIAAEMNYGDGPTLNKQNFNRINVFAKYNLALSKYTFITTSLSAFSSKWNASGQVPTRAVDDGTIDRFGSIDPTEGGNTERYNANLIIKSKFKNGATLENQVYYSKYKFNLYSNFTFFLNNPIDGDQINQAESRNIFGLHSKYNHKKKFNSFTLSSTYGLGVRNDITNNSQLSNTNKRILIDYIKLGDIKETNAFAYLQQQVNIGKFSVDAGVRLDYLHFNYFDKLSTSQLPAQGKAIVTPKLNIQYNFTNTIQAYVKAGKGFHSNDTRVVTANNGNQILPAAYGGDIGIMIKPTKNLLLNIAVWYLNLDQEFVYVGDAGIVEPSGKTRREGIDIIARYQFNKYFFGNLNLNFTKPRAIDEPKGNNFIPLAPTATSTGGLFYKKNIGFNGGLSYRYIKNRSANEDNSIIAKGYFLLDATINYTKSKYEFGFNIENMLNSNWNEAQFETTSRLRTETTAVTEIHFTPGVPFFLKAKLTVFF